MIYVERVAMERVVRRYGYASLDDVVTGRDGLAPIPEDLEIRWQSSKGIASGSYETHYRDLPGALQGAYQTFIIHLTQYLQEHIHE